RRLSPQRRVDAVGNHNILENAYRITQFLSGGCGDGFGLHPGVFYRCFKCELARTGLIACTVREATRQSRPGHDKGVGNLADASRVAHSYTQHASRLVGRPELDLGLQRTGRGKSIEGALPDLRKAVL